MVLQLHLKFPVLKNEHVPDTWRTKNSFTLNSLSLALSIKSTTGIILSFDEKIIPENLLALMSFSKWTK